MLKLAPLMRQRDLTTFKKLLHERRQELMSEAVGTMQGMNEIESFDGQALNEDIVISMSRFDSIDLDVDRARVTAGAGATWGAVVRAIAPHGFVPFTVVSTSYASVGGTVSGDCLSRFSGAAGKEGRYIEMLELLTPGGRLLERGKAGDRPFGLRHERQGVVAGGAEAGLDQGRLPPCGAAPPEAETKVAPSGTATLSTTPLAAGPDPFAATSSNTMSSPVNAVANVVRAVAARCVKAPMTDVP